MADVPVPGTELIAADHGADLAATLRTAIPPDVHGLLATLWAGGHAAYVVGGSLRDAVLGRPAEDWDLASDALPERVLELVPGSVYENRFGTVAIRQGGDLYEITTFRSDHDYADFRRPHRVEFGDTIEVDLARRDLTCNAMAWGAVASAADAPGLVDPYDGATDTRAHVLRAVGDARQRFEEDALRMVRTVRLAATLGFDVEAATLAGIQAKAELVRHLSGERIATELDKLLAAETAVDRAAAARGYRAAGWDRRGAGGPARDPAEQDRGRGPLGPHPPLRGRGAGGAPGRPARGAGP